MSSPVLGVAGHSFPDHTENQPVWNDVMIDEDPHNLRRFLEAQAGCYDSALRELAAGRKESHWIWYIFPQLAGLGHSASALRYAIHSREEAVAYWQHALLGVRLQQCCEALLAHGGTPIEAILGFPDHLKLRSSMTLFHTVSPEADICREVLKTFYGGEKDPKTLDFLTTRP